MTEKRLEGILDTTSKKGLDGLKGLFISMVSEKGNGNYVAEDILFERRIKIELDDYEVYQGIRYKGHLIYVKKEKKQ